MLISDLSYLENVSENGLILGVLHWDWMPFHQWTVETL